MELRRLFVESGFQDSGSQRLVPQAASRPGATVFHGRAGHAGSVRLKPEEAMEQLAAFQVIQIVQDGEAGHIPGARLVSAQNAHMVVRGIDFTTPILLVTSDDTPTDTIVDAIQSEGGGPTYLLDGGFAAWEHAGLPIADLDTPHP
jgi:rhodanese-related sulfurtransferase